MLINETLFVFANAFRLCSVAGCRSKVPNALPLDKWIFIRPLIAISGIVFWRGIDQGVIDATLDGSADTARDISDNLRHMQSGNLRSYAGWVAVGAMVVIIYMVWVGLRTT